MIILQNLNDEKGGSRWRSILINGKFLINLNFNAYVERKREN